MTPPDSQTAAGGSTPSVSRITNGVPADASLKDLLGRMSSNLSHLVHLELELAKVEIKGEVARSGKAAGFLGGTGLAGYFGLLMISFAAAFGLAEIMATGWAFLIVGLIYVAVAAFLWVSGRKKLAAVRLMPERTVGTLKEDLSWLKQQMS